MALNREDKADVKGAMGKAIANKVSRVTKDRHIHVVGQGHGVVKKPENLQRNPVLSPKSKVKVSVGAKPSEIGHTISDHKGNILSKNEGKGRFSLSAKSKALKERSYSGHYQEGKTGRITQLSSKRATKLGMDTY